MKKLFTIILALILIFLCSCANSEENSSQNEVENLKDDVLDQIASNDAEVNSDQNNQENADEYNESIDISNKNNNASVELDSDNIDEIDKREVVIDRSYDFSKSNWGMTKEEVIQAESLTPEYILEQDDNAIYVNNCTFMNKNVILSFLFENGQLTQGTIIYDYDYLANNTIKRNDPDDVFSYEEMREYLSELYGFPQEVDLEHWIGSMWYVDSSEIMLCLTDGLLGVIYNQSESSNINTNYSYGNSTTQGSSTGNENALQSAIDYLNYVGGFSYEGLWNQLEYEGFTSSEIQYALDNCGADWNQQAVISARKYLDTMSFSRQGLIEQLEYEGFTYDQAVYGVEKCGY